MITKATWIVVLFSALFGTSSYSLAGEDSNKKDKKEKKEKTLASTLSGKTQHEGLINIYRDPQNGDGYLLIDESQLNKPFLYFATTVNGALDAGHFKGAFRQYKLIEFRRYFKRIDIVTKTPRYYFDPDNAISKAAGTNVSEAVLVSAKMEVNEGGQYLIKLNDVFMNEKLHRIAPKPKSDTAKEEKRFKLGKLSADKSRIVSIDNFPNNTHIVVDYVYENDAPKVRGNRELSDPRYVSLKLQHALIKLPENNFKPRADDPRLGYFTQQFDDLTSDQTVNYRDVINRWHLEKKDPSLAVSDPVKPITWWIENTTPQEWRDTIRRAALAWNPAFEKAGISNAIEIKVQPDDATWSADDVRYNVLRWTSSPRPPFGGYGPSIANPLTGEILAADIMLEYNFMKGRWITAKMLTDGLDAAQPEVRFNDQLYCSLGHGMSQNLALGQTMAMIKGMEPLEQNEMLRQTMHYLILHEIGHTLGLNHNMKASQLHSRHDAYDADKTQGILAGSIMDYPAINFSPNGVTQGDFYSEKPGPYDDWAIEYGYSQSLDDEQAERTRLNNILARSTEPALAFGNDADDMRTPGRHIDPRVNIFDMSDDAIGYAQDRFDLITHASSGLKSKILSEGQSHHNLVVGTNVLLTEWTRQANVVSRYIGGIYLDRAFVGQNGGKQPFTPVDEATQKRAMKTLSDYVFAPDAAANMQPLYAYLQKQRRSFDAYGKNEDPKPHAALLTAQKGVLDHLLHPATMQRLSDTALYGNTYGVEKALSDLTDAIFASDIKKDVNSHRRNLQIEYVGRLIKVSGLEKTSHHDYLAQSTAVYELNKILSMVNGSRGQQATKVHKFYLRDRIHRAFHKSKR